MKYVLLTATAVALNLTAFPAIAATVPETSVSERVDFADLNLTMKSDQVRLERRVRATISRLCVNVESASPAPPGSDFKCFEASLKDARRQMDRAIARANGGSTLAAATPAEAR